MPDSNIQNQQVAAKFKALYLEEYGIQLTDEEAKSLATKLLTLFETLSSND